MRLLDRWFLGTTMVALAAMTAPAAAGDSEPPGTCPAVAAPQEPPSPPVRTPAAASSAFHCGDELVLCLDRDGDLFADDTQPTALGAGDVLVVQVISAIVNDKSAVTLAVTPVGPRDRLIKSQPGGVVGGGARTAAVAGGPKAYDVVATHSSAPVPSSARKLRIGFARTGAAGVPLRQRDIPVARGFYLMEFGVGIPVVFDGYRKVAGPAAIEQHSEPQIALSAIVAFKRHADGDVIRPVGLEWFGAQLATDFDFTADPRKKRFYLGIVFAPIAGLGISAGVAVLPGQYLPPGAVVPDGGSSMGPSSVERTMARPYVSIHVTDEILTAARAFANGLK